MPDEAAGADGDAAASSLEDPAEIVQEGGYTEQHIFHVDETAFCWKKMSPGTVLAREAKSVPGFKASRERLTLSLGPMQLVTLG